MKKKPFSKYLAAIEPLPDHERVPDSTMISKKIEKPLITSITSGKGGVGKTFVAVNLAACLARQGKKVLVADCDLGLSNVDIMLGINPESSLKDVLFGERTLREVIVPTKGGFDLIPACSGVREMAQLLYEKIQTIKSGIAAFTDYDIILLDTGAGISEVVLQFNLMASRNIVIINKELTCLTDAYAMMKIMYQVFGHNAFSIIVNCATDDREGEKIFNHMDSICRRFLDVSLDYLGSIMKDERAARSILRQEVLVQSDPKSRIAANFAAISRAVNRQEHQNPRTSGFHKNEKPAPTEKIS
jgi:flagellar biosynthesis protein FlhG